MKCYMCIALLKDAHELRPTPLFPRLSEKHEMIDRWEAVQPGHPLRASFRASGKIFHFDHLGRRRCAEFSWHGGNAALFYVEDWIFPDILLIFFRLFPANDRFQPHLPQITCHGPSSTRFEVPPLFSQSWIALIAHKAS